MAPRYRKLVGTFAILPYLFIYLFAAAALGDLLPRFWLSDLVYFAIAGSVWVFPLKYLLKWMTGSDSA
ncbi:MAG: DUF2842 domain-containing protein [Pseudomonadota bacterium]